MHEDLARIHDERPWGSFDQFTHNRPSTVKLITVSAGKRLSLQRHLERAEFWRVVSGSGSAEVDTTFHELSVGSEVWIPVGALHRLTGGTEGITVLEVAFGTFDENDIERVEDDFGRTST